MFCIRIKKIIFNYTLLSTGLKGLPPFDWLQSKNTLIDLISTLCAVIFQNSSFVKMLIIRIQLIRIHNFSCADPESFVRGPNLIRFFFGFF